MCRKGENIHKRKDGRWEARIKVTINGVSKTKSLYAHTYREVKDKMLSEKGQSTCICNNQQRTFEDISREWFIVQSAKHKEATLLKYHTVVDTHILPAFGTMEIDKIKETEIAEFISKKMISGNLKTGKPLSASYVRLILVIMTSILDYSASMGYSSAIKYRFATKFIQHKSKTDVLEQNNRIILEKYTAACVNPVSTGIALALHAGLRIGEVCALRWEDVDAQNRIIHIRHTVSRIQNNDMSVDSKTCLILDEPKTITSRRDIPINSNLLDILKKMHQISDSDYVVSDAKDFVSPRTFEYRFHKELEKAGIMRINFHKLRHTFATRCIEVGIDTKTVSELLGHASVNITLNTYVHSSFEQKKKQIEKLILQDI